MPFLAWILVALGGAGYAGWWRFLKVTRPGPTAISERGIGPDQVQGVIEGLRIRASNERADAALVFAPTTVASVKLLVEGRNFFPAIIADIEAATESVHINQYGMKPGKIADMFLPVLERKAREGVEIRMTLDAIGSAVDGATKPMLDRLADAGLQIAIHDGKPPDRTGLWPDRVRDNRWDEVGRVDHRKLYVIDGKTAWIGGAGIEDHFENGKFHDLFVQVTGNVVRQMQASFLASFRYLGGPLPSGSLDRYFPAPADPGSTPVTFLLNWPRLQLPVTEAAERLMEGATTTLDVMSPYVGDAAMRRRLTDAAARGVRTRLVVPDRDHGNSSAWAALAHHYPTLLAAGVEVWEYPALVHAKCVVADDVVLVGTLNMDAWALYRNPEIALVFPDAGVANTFRTDLFETDIATSKRGEPATDQLTKIKGAVLDRFADLL